MPRPTRSFVPVALIAAALLTGGSSSASAATEGRLARPLVIGSVASLSGDASSYGRDQARGSSLAAATIGRDGGRLSLREVDDRSLAGAAQRAFRRLVEVPVGAIIGPTLSPVAEAADPIATRAGIPVLAATNTTLAIGRLPTVWRVGLGEEAMIPAAVGAARDRHDLSRAGLLVDGADGYARGAAAAFVRAARRGGVEITSRASFGTAGATAETAVASLLGGAPESRPQAIFIAARSDAAVAALKAVRVADPAIPLVGGNGFNSDAVIAAAGAAANGLIVAAAWNRGIVHPGSLAFVHAYRKRYGTPPSAFSAQGYASVEVAAAASRVAGDASAAGVLRGLRRLGTLDTVLGPLRFDERREARYPAAVQIVRGGRFELLRGETSLRGSWTGLLHQRGMRPFRVWARIADPDGGAGNTVRYSGLGCRGRWTALAAAGVAHRFTETITAGAGGACKGSGTVSLRPTGDPNALRYVFRGGGVTSSGILRRS